MWTSNAVVGAEDAHAMFWDGVPLLLSTSRQLRLVIVHRSLPTTVLGEHLWPEFVLLHSDYYRASVDGVLDIQHYDR